MRHGAVLGLIWLVFVVPGPQALYADQPDKPLRPSWIWNGSSPGENDSCYFRKQFTLDHDVVTARLVLAADHSDVAMYLNGQRVGRVENYDPDLWIDVSGKLRRGTNQIAVRCTASDGPSAFMSALFVGLANATQARICSDSSWITTRVASANWRELNFSPRGWQPAANLGHVEKQRWSDELPSIKIDQLDDYTQWKQAIGAGKGTLPSSFLVPDGFQVELLRSATPAEGSWVSLAIDQRGRAIIGKEKEGLLRITLPRTLTEPAQVETVNYTLRECRGLLLAFGALYANANNDLALYRLRDTTGDDRYDKVELLRKSAGSVGHGRNDLVLGPDNHIYVIHGDAVQVSKGASFLPPTLANIGPGDRLPNGHVIRTDRDGRQWQVVAKGLRNPFGIDFNSDGEMFTYDADAEHDMGASWYRPTRVHHIVSSADFGWRRVTGHWPPYFPDHPDSPPTVLDIGKGSPTAVKFGWRSDFPPRYQRALFILDWAYGRIIAVHLFARGSSYVARAETFLRGRPLNVTDLDFGPDGAMYFVTGGRGTQSALYRVSYLGKKVEQPPISVHAERRQNYARNARKLRRELESLHGQQGDDILRSAWSHLDNSDPWIRHAARVVIEHHQVDRWREQALNENRPTARLAALLALARAGNNNDHLEIQQRLLRLSMDQLDGDSKLLTVLRTYELGFQQAGPPDTATAKKIVTQLDLVFPSPSFEVNRDLSRMLVGLNAPTCVAKCMSLLESAGNAIETLHYLFVLREVKQGWTDHWRARYFTELAAADSFPGGEGMPKFVRQIRGDALAAVPDGQRDRFRRMLNASPEASSEVLSSIQARPLVKVWSMSDLQDSLDQVLVQGNVARGEQLFKTVLCDQCHRMGRQGRAVGPDLTSVANRFSPRDILQSIISPSYVIAEKYRQRTMVMSDGRVITGRVALQRDYRSPSLQIATDPFHEYTTIEIAKRDIVQSKPSDQSPMPDGLLNTLNKQEILDLLAYLTSGTQQANTPIE